MEKLEVKQYPFGGRCNGLWFIGSADKSWDAEYLWHDLTLHYQDTGGLGGSGYYKTKAEAERFLKAYKYLQLSKEKYKMADNIEINVKVNGKDVPLHEVSEQILLTIRKASKPKPVPVFQVVDTCFNGSRLIFKVTRDIANWVDQYVCIDKDGEVVYNSGNIRQVLMGYSNIRELRLDEV